MCIMTQPPKRFQGHGPQLSRSTPSGDWHMLASSCLLSVISCLRNLYDRRHYTTFVPTVAPVHTLQPACSNQLCAALACRRISNREYIYGKSPMTCRTGLCDIGCSFPRHIFAHAMKSSEIIPVTARVGYNPKFRVKWNFKVTFTLKIRKW